LSFDNERLGCEVNNGVKVKPYGGSRDSELRQLDVALDREKRVIDVDDGNGKVKQFNIQLAVLTWSRERSPQHLFYDRKTSQLMVGLDTGQVEIFGLLLLFKAK
jgi:hypothetical protein